jgi:hypothetical protein
MARIEACATAWALCWAETPVNNGSVKRLSNDSLQSITISDPI